MKHLFLTVLAGLALTSCGRDADGESSGGSKGFRSPSTLSFGESEFSPWMTKAQQQIAQDNKPATHYFAYTEGRNNGGLQEYRHVLKPFPKDKFAEWGVYWGLSSNEFYQIELKMLRGGFVRESLQVYTDAQGAAVHQAVWLRPLSK